MATPIQRLLVANRGEIARRIFRTAHTMGISTVAVYADGDRGAPFVRDADMAVALGGETSSETYLVAEKIIDAALSCGADAIHPGYGFLSENAEFARSVEKAGIVWVGPSPEAIETMGDKLSAKELMKANNVPTLPAAELGENPNLGGVAAEIGYPLLVKACAGGGGKGMRVVAREEDLEAAVAAAQREAGASFGDDTVFLERWLAKARHVEVQLLGDRHGNLVHCFERECSIQRRHQKVIEEAPSPAVTEALRRRMGEAALAAGAAMGYSSAGTVEFLLEGQGDDAAFWFLEVNTRLQVEHPVTEEITGLDLVREQIRVAQGEPLGFSQEDLTMHGHAIEARLYAEDPDNDFLPVTGRVLRFEPSTQPSTRFESGIESGSVVGVHFDPMLAKVIVHAATRTQAALALARALETTRIQGITTNRDFLVGTLRSAEFLAGDTTTDFLERVPIAGQRALNEQQINEAAMLATMALQRNRRAAAALTSQVPSGWRNTRMPPEEQSLLYGDRALAVGYQSQRDGSFEVTVDGGEPQRVKVVEDGTTSEARVTLEVGTLESSGQSGGDGCEGNSGAGARLLKATVTVDRCSGRPTRVLVFSTDGEVELLLVSRFPIKAAEVVAGGLVAPMPGKVLSTQVAVGDTVEERQLLLVLEAMKMEHNIHAPHAGSVVELRVVEGDQVENGELLVVLEEAHEEAQEGYRKMATEE